jgi:uncharacterized membrane protein
MLPMLRPQATDRDLRRVVGVDMARCLALLGMMATHILPGFEGLEVPWPQQLAGGRASALFAVLAGVSMSLMTGREHPVQGSERMARSCGLAFRALLIATLGLYLAVLETSVAIILTYYGLLFLLGLPFLGLGARALAVLAGCWMVVLPIVSHMLRPELPDRLPGSPSLDRLGDPVQLLTELAFTGTYPVVPWMSYLFVGMAIGRLDLRAANVAWRLLLGGAAMAATAWVLARIISGGEAAQEALRSTLTPGSTTSQEALDATLVHGLFGVTPTESWWWLTVVAPHSTTPFDLAQTTGSAIAVIGFCLLVSRLQPRVCAVAFGAGAMSLSLYSLHIFMLTPEVWPPIESGVYLRHVIVVLVIGAVFAWFRWRGPLEFTVATLSGQVTDSVRARRSQPDRA